MSSSRSRQQATAPRAAAPRTSASTSDGLPLRSLAAVWAGFGVLGLCLIVLAGRGLWSSSSSSTRAQVTALPKGPTKRQVRERQEHIALTERALELARKERSAATAASAAAPATSAPAPSAPAPGGASAPAGTPAAAPKKAAVPSDAAPSSATEAAPAEKPAGAAQKPAASSGLDEMRANIASQFE